MLKELGAQVTISAEFGRETPKRVAEFSDNQAFTLIQKLDELNDKNIDITSDEYQNTIKELDTKIKGASISLQACSSFCLGVSTNSTNHMATYGVGTKQIGYSGGSLKFSGYHLNRNTQKIVKGESNE